MLSAENLNEPELYFPLKIYTCHNCWLVQVDEIQKADKIFDAEYTYFSSFSTSWLEHAKKYTEKMIDRFGFDQTSQVMVICCNISKKGASLSWVLTRLQILQKKQRKKELLQSWIFLDPTLPTINLPAKAQKPICCLEIMYWPMFPISMIL